jgi:hypothetical protein
MEWKDLNVFQYQQLEPILTGGDIIGNATKIIAIINNDTEAAVEKYPFKRLSKEIKKMYFLLTEIKGYPVKYIRTAKNRYICNYDISQINTARYIETKVFAKDVIQNLHKLAASMVYPLNFGIFKKKYNASKHSDYADDIQSAKFLDVYYSVSKFIKVVSDLDSNFKGLYEDVDEQMEEQSMRGGNRFVEFYGWHYCVKIVAEHEIISLNQAYELPCMQFLNDLSYLKAERDYLKR